MTTDKRITRATSARPTPVAHTSSRSMAPPTRTTRATSNRPTAVATTSNTLSGPKPVIPQEKTIFLSSSIGSHNLLRELLRRLLITDAQLQTLFSGPDRPATMDGTAFVKDHPENWPHPFLQSLFHLSQNIKSPTAIKVLVIEQAVKRRKPKESNSNKGKQAVVQPQVGVDSKDVSAVRNRLIRLSKDNPNIYEELMVQYRDADLTLQAFSREGLVQEKAQEGAGAASEETAPQNPTVGEQGNTAAEEAAHAANESEAADSSIINDLDSRSARSQAPEPEGLGEAGPSFQAPSRKRQRSPDSQPTFRSKRFMLDFMKMTDIKEVLETVMPGEKEFYDDNVYMDEADFASAIIAKKALQEIRQGQQKFQAELLAQRRRERLYLDSLKK